MATEISSSPGSNSRTDEPKVAAPAPLSAAHVAAAILLPPLALFLVRGVSRDFWIAFGLTCLGFLPGVAFALFVLLKGRSQRSAPA
jgi:uncharacterized membrane protein YqaE (UPF0057 family)